VYTCSISRDHIKHIFFFDRHFNFPERLIKISDMYRVRKGFGKFWKLIEVFSRVWKVLENLLSLAFIWLWKVM
jgi:hypothetical protein